MPGKSYLTGLFRRIRTMLLRHEVEVIGQCRGCGKCCQGILLKDQGRFLSKKRQFDKLCESEPQFSRFEIIERSLDGHLVFNCSAQGEDNFCTCYASRLPLCRSYPDKAIYYHGGWLRSDCGFSFKATSFRDVYMRRKRGKIPSFDRVLRQEIQQEKKQKSS